MTTENNQAQEAPESGLFRGDDGNLRCAWPGLAQSELYRRYHDEEWGRPVSGEALLFERLSLEAFQSGLSWLTILRKREAFRQAFHGFDPHAVAAFGAEHVRSLMANAEIVRNRAKIEATIANAKAILALAPRESLAELFARFAPTPRPAGSPIPSQTTQSKELAKELKRRGFRFLGPTTVYAMMQAIGLVNDHQEGCWVRHARSNTR